MKISLSWLKTLINTRLDHETIATMLTDSGLEVEGVTTFESVAGGLKGLVVGEVIECSKHPDADRLSVTKVNIGEGQHLSIVCGAPNVAKGQKVVVATPGTKLYPVSGEPFEIKRSKIRGVASEGMICAEDEIGLGTDHAGIMVLPGDIEPGLPAADYFNVESDTVLEIGLTPNRNDAASHYGVARELAAILNSQNHNHAHEVHIQGLAALPEATDVNKCEVELRNPALCKRYSGIVLSGVTVKESPVWLQNRLKSIGVRPINNIVDITNFVLHELGQPLHAFDLDKIGGRKIVVRTAKEGEKFTALDGITYELHKDDLMICDEEKPMCIAGVFGGLDSGITSATTSIFIESAFFDPQSVRRTSKRHALKTDASFRFERGTDPEMTVNALHRAANLILDLAGGFVSMDPVDIYAEKLLPHKVAFSYKNCIDIIGKEIERNIIKNIILNLGIEIDSEGTDGLLLMVPHYKADVTREIDVVEEVMRIYGYNHIEPGKHISYTAANEEKNFDLELENRLSSIMEARGFSEIMSLSLSRETLYTDSSRLVKVLNPLSSDLNVLRGNLLYSGLEAIAYNINRRNTDLKFYETGRVYSSPEKGRYEEEKRLSLFVTGSLFNENPYGLKQEASFSYMKGVIDTLLAKLGVSGYKTTDLNNEELTGLTYVLGKNNLLSMGTVPKGLLKQFDIKQEVLYASVSWEQLLRAFSRRSIRFEEPGRFPSVRRDLALLIDRSVKYRDIEELAFSTEKKYLESVSLFDIYEDKKLGNKRSYAVRFTLADPQATLTDKQIESVMDKLIKAYKEKLGAELR